MSRKQKWKDFGINTGQAFKNFAQAAVKTASIVVGNEKNDQEENGKSKLKNAWTKTGKGFGKAGSSLGHAFSATFKGDPDDVKKDEEKPTEPVNPKVIEEPATEDNENEPKEE